MIPVALVAQKHCVIANIVVVSLRDNGSVRVPKNVVVDASVSSRVRPPKWAVHPYPVFWHIVNPVVGNCRSRLLRLHHLHYCSIRL